MVAEDGRWKIPPVFDEKKSYESWKNEVEIWRLVTDLDKKKQALAVALSLMGRARDSVMEIAAGDLNKDDGMTTLLTKLALAYTEFDRVTRESGVSFVCTWLFFEMRAQTEQKKITPLLLIPAPMTPMSHSGSSPFVHPPLPSLHLPHSILPFYSVLL